MHEFFNNRYTKDEPRLSLELCEYLDSVRGELSDTDRTWLRRYFIRSTYDLAYIMSVLKGENIQQFLAEQKTNVEPLVGSMRNLPVYGYEDVYTLIVYKLEESGIPMLQEYAENFKALGEKPVKAGSRVFKFFTECKYKPAEIYYLNYKWLDRKSDQTEYQLKVRIVDSIFQQTTPISDLEKAVVNELLDKYSVGTQKLLYNCHEIVNKQTWYFAMELFKAGKIAKIAKPLRVYPTLYADKELFDSLDQETKYSMLEYSISAFKDRDSLVSFLEDNGLQGFLDPALEHSESVISTLLEFELLTMSDLAEDALEKQIYPIHNKQVAEWINENFDRIEEPLKCFRKEGSCYYPPYTVYFDLDKPFIDDELYKELLEKLVECAYSVSKQCFFRLLDTALQEQRVLDLYGKDTLAQVLDLLEEYSHKEGILFRYLDAEKFVLGKEEHQKKEEARKEQKKQEENARKKKETREVNKKIKTCFADVNSVSSLVDANNGYSFSYHYLINERGMYLKALKKILLAVLKTASDYDKAVLEIVDALDFSVKEYAFVYSKLAELSEKVSEVTSEKTDESSPVEKDTSEGGAVNE